MSSKTVNIIGAGKVGINLGRAFIQQELAQIKSVYNLHFDKAITACKLMGAGEPLQNLALLAQTQVTWLTCSDDAIPDVVQQLLQSAKLPSGSFVIHSSGVLSSTALSPLREAGCLVGSAHPLKAFAPGIIADNAFADVHCVIEGDPAVCTWLTQTFQKLNAKVSTIQPEHKAMYHAGACIASNFLITLAFHAEQLFLKAGISKELSHAMVTQLMQGNLNNLQKTSSIKRALTGPMARGDLKTLELHLLAIDDPLLTELYNTASRATLPVTALSDEQKNQINDLLRNDLKARDILQSPG